jgi:hypothetical protein
LSADTVNGIGANIKSSGPVTIRPHTAGRSIGLNDPTGDFQLTTAELSRIQGDGGLIIGSTDAGAIAVAGGGALDLGLLHSGLTLMGAATTFGGTLTAPFGRTMTLSTGSVRQLTAGAAVSVAGPNGAVRLSTSGSVGSATAPFVVATPSLETSAVAGDLYLTATNPGTVVADTLTATGTISLTTSGDLFLHPGDLAAPTVALNFAGSGSQTLATGGTVLTDLIHTGTGTLTVTDGLTLSGSFANRDGAGDVNIVRQKLPVGGDWSWGSTGRRVGPVLDLTLNGAGSQASRPAASS